MSITAPLAEHHVRCDELFAEAEEVCAKAQWDRATGLFAAFNEELERHFKIEEELLFPAFESATGMRMGPTEVMRQEHRQMRDLLAGMAQAIPARDGDAFSGGAETLLILMQQHNMKEENILYPMCDQNVDAATVGAEVQQRLDGGRR